MQRDDIRLLLTVLKWSLYLAVFLVAFFVLGAAYNTEVGTATSLFCLVVPAAFVLIHLVINSLAQRLAGGSL